MGLRLPGVRPGEGRDTAGAFLTLFGLMAGHALLETARDALFLAEIAPTRLPWVYLAIAVLAVGFARLARAGARQRLSLCLWILGGGGVTLAFWWMLGREGEWPLYALYIWSGLLSTLLVVRFWLLSGNLFTVSQAKRLFALVGTGSILGAVSGSALAQAIVLRFDPRHMLLAAAGVLMLTAIVPALLRPSADGARPPRRDEEESTEGFRETLRRIGDHPYLRRLAGLVLLSTVALTLADLTFKSAVANGVAPDQLAWVFALVYMIVNVVSLAVQLVVVGWATRNLSIDRVLSFLPALLLVASSWLLLGGGLLAAMLLKGFDGPLRHSLHRTATEILSVPLPADWRERVKGLVDVAGQRGGQAVASLAFLAVASAGVVGEGGAADRILGVLLVLLCGGWIVVAVGIKRHYFNLFRSALDEGAFRTRIEFPDLDLASLETLMTALASPDEAEVSAALDLLAAKGRLRLVPPLILYHPSPHVVVRALDLFDSQRRTDHFRIARSLLSRPEPEVRTAALLALPPSEIDPGVLEEAMNDESAEVRSTALVGLYSGEDPHPRIQSILETLLHAGSSEARQALARAAARRPDPRMDGLLVSLAALGDAQVGREVARAMRSDPKPRYLVCLRDLLALRAARGEARKTLVSIGDPAFDFLTGALADEALPRAVRRHLPRTLSDFDPVRAGAALLARLPVEPDGAVRFKILRALGRLRARHPGLPLDRRTLEDSIESTLETIFRLLDWRVALIHNARDRAEWRTRVRELVVELLGHKERHALERLFRLFSLRHPREDFKRIHRGVASGDRKARAGARELLEGTLRSPIREAVLGLLDDLPDAQRLQAGRRFHRPGAQEQAALLRTLLEQGNVPLRCLVAYHVAELGLADLRTELQQLCEDAVGAMEDSFRNALERLDDPGKEGAFVVPVR